MRQCRALRARRDLARRYRSHSPGKPAMPCYNLIRARRCAQVYLRHPRHSFRVEPKTILPEEYMSDIMVKVNFSKTKQGDESFVAALYQGGRQIKTKSFSVGRKRSRQEGYACAVSAAKAL